MGKRREDQKTPLKGSQLLGWRNPKQKDGEKQGKDLWYMGSKPPKAGNGKRRAEKLRLEQRVEEEKGHNPFLKYCTVDSGIQILTDYNVKYYWKGTVRRDGKN